MSCMKPAERNALTSMVVASASGAAESSGRTHCIAGYRTSRRRRVEERLLVLSTSFLGGQARSAETFLKFEKVANVGASVRSRAAGTRVDRPPVTCKLPVHCSPVSSAGRKASHNSSSIAHLATSRIQRIELPTKATLAKSSRANTHAAGIHFIMRSAVRASLFPVPERLLHARIPPSSTAPPIRPR